MSYRSFYMPVSISTIAKHKGSKVNTNHQIILDRMYEMVVWVYEITTQCYENLNIYRDNNIASHK